VLCGVCGATLTAREYLDGDGKAQRASGSEGQSPSGNRASPGDSQGSPTTTPVPGVTPRSTRLPGASRPVLRGVRRGIGAGSRWDRSPIAPTFGKVKRTNGLPENAGRWGSLVSFGLRVAVTTIQIRAGHFSRIRFQSEQRRPSGGRNHVPASEASGDDESHAREATAGSDPERLVCIQIRAGPLLPHFQPVSDSPRQLQSVFEND